jgi:hypothetical protein
LRVPNQGLNRSTDEPALGQGTEEGAATVTGQQHVPINKPIIQHYINNGMVQGDNILRELHKQELKENSLLTAEKDVNTNATGDHVPKEKLNSNKGKTEVINQEPTVPGTQTTTVTTTVGAERLTSMVAMLFKDEPLEKQPSIYHISEDAIRGKKA